MSYAEKQRIAAERAECQRLKSLGYTREEISQETGLSKRQVKSRLQATTDPGIIDALAAVGIENMDLVSGGWLKNSEASIQFRMPKAEEDPNRIVDALKEGLADVPPAPYINTPAQDDSLCAVFPVADLHMGLLTDEEEVGADWDTKIAQQKFSETFSRLRSITPAAGTAILAQLGDLMHNDDQKNMTPQSNHVLDVDSRYFVILRRAVAAMKWAIDDLRTVYPKVIYRGCRGNHDPTAHYAVTLALHEHYRDVEGVEIVTNASEFYVWEFGRNMLLLHHGDKVKPERLQQMASAEWSEMWGRTKHRLALSGHIHHETRKEVGGMVFESIGTIAPRDAYAFSHGYTARRSLVSITLDKDQGEVNRARVSVG